MNKIASKVDDLIKWMSEHRSALAGLGGAAVGGAIGHTVKPEGDKSYIPEAIGAGLGGLGGYSAVETLAPYKPSEFKFKDGFAPSMTFTDKASLPTNTQIALALRGNTLGDIFKGQSPEFVKALEAVKGLKIPEDKLKNFTARLPKEHQPLASELLKAEYILSKLSPLYEDVNKTYKGTM